MNNKQQMAGSTIKPSSYSLTTVPIYKTATNTVVEKLQLATTFRVPVLLNVCPSSSMAWKAAYRLSSERTAMLTLACACDRGRNHIYTVAAHVEKASCLKIVRHFKNRTKKCSRVMPFMSANNRALHGHSNEIVGIERCSDLKFRKHDCCTGSVCFNNSLKTESQLLVKPCFLSEAPTLKANVS